MNLNNVLKWGILELTASFTFPSCGKTPLRAGGLVSRTWSFSCDFHLRLYTLSVWHTQIRALWLCNNLSEESFQELHPVASSWTWSAQLILNEIHAKWSTWLQRMRTSALCPRCDHPNTRFVLLQYPCNASIFITAPLIPQNKISHKNWN